MAFSVPCQMEEQAAQLRELGPHGKHYYDMLVPSISWSGAPSCWFHIVDAARMVFKPMCFKTMIRRSLEGCHSFTLPVLYLLCKTHQTVAVTTRWWPSCRITALTPKVTKPPSILLPALAILLVQIDCMDCPMYAPLRDTLLALHQLHDTFSHLLHHDLCMKSVGFSALYTKIMWQDVVIC